MIKNSKCTTCLNNNIKRQFVCDTCKDNRFFNEEYPQDGIYHGACHNCDFIKLYKRCDGCRFKFPDWSLPDLRSDDLSTLRIKKLSNILKVPIKYE